MSSRVGGRLIRYQPVTAAGQVFRMEMYHPNHPDGNYPMANRVQVSEPPRTPEAIAEACVALANTRDATGQTLVVDGGLGLMH